MQLSEANNTPDWIGSEAEFSRALPATLVGVLERRYLAALDPAEWRISSHADDVSRPLLLEVLELGRAGGAGQGFHAAMCRLLSACHDPGHAFVMLLDGQGGRHRLQFGTRRILGASGGSTEDHLTALESAMRGNFPGIQLGPVKRLDRSLQAELADFFENAPGLGVMTGVPPAIWSSERIAQGMEHFVAGVDSRHYAIMTVAEPVSDAEVDAALDACRRLKGEIHAYVRSTIQRSKSESETYTELSESGRPEWVSRLPNYLHVLIGFSALIPGAAPLATAAQGIGSGLVGHLRNEHPDPVQTSISKSLSESGSRDLLDANALACEALLDTHIQRLQCARSVGWWRNAIYIAAENEATLRACASSIRGMLSAEVATVDPMRLLVLPENIVRENLVHGRLMSLLPAFSGATGHPLGKLWDGLSTCVNSSELAALISPPRDEIAGLPLRDHPSFALSAPQGASGEIRLGDIQDTSGRSVGQLRLTAAELNRHVFITGIPGSGKTNSSTQLVRQTFAENSVPFLVIEPVKREYRSLATAPELAGRISVFAAGSGSGRPLRLNPLAPIPGIPIGRHIDMLKAVFNASFPMFAGMPYILEEALIEVYIERGWSLTESENPHLSSFSNVDERSSMLPDLRDLLAKVDEVLGRKNYGKEVYLNMGAALRSRLNSLLVGSKGLLFDTRRSTSQRDLFESPAVIELQDLSDDQEKSFVMALLLVLLYEHAEVRQGSRTEGSQYLQHLTLIEEAHRLLATQNASSAAETGDARGKSISMFVDMLAEMRAYGEGFVIIDQVPSQLAPQVVKNTSLKIIHRLTAPDDRNLCGACVGLNEAQTRSLNTLRPGSAVVHDDSIGEAVRVKVSYAKLDANLHANIGPSTSSVDAFATLSLLRHAGCRSCESPCRYYPMLRDARIFTQLPALDPLIYCVYFANWESARSEWQAWRAHVSSRLQNVVGGTEKHLQGALYCAATQMAYEWIQTLLVSRRAYSDTLSPKERLAREPVAQHLGKLLAQLSGPGAPPEIRPKAFDAAHAALRAMTVQPPDGECPGCAACPERCAMLAFTAPKLDDIRRQWSTTVVKDLVQITTSLRTLFQQFGAKTPVKFAPNQKYARQSWMYCVATNLEFDRELPILDALLQDLAKEADAHGATL